MRRWWAFVCEDFHEKRIAVPETLMGIGAGVFAAVGWESVAAALATATGLLAGGVFLRNYFRLKTVTVSAQLVHLCRPTPVMGEKGQVGFAVSVFNGNRKPIKLAAERVLYYGPAQDAPKESRKVVESSDVVLIGIDEEIAPGSSREVRVFIRLRGALGEEIQRDIDAGRLKPIRVDGLGLSVNGASLPLPAVWINLSKSEQWVLGLGHAVGEADGGRNVASARADVGGG